ncbi:hypothetical protein [Brevibacillus brevis]|uniref:hypothetical protein n=1 Tax=Brevibacillus brevis TaxID=1393 RepID=UPI00064FDC87|nr:hypothetical protein [Brevibacillus brevis]
MEEPLFYDFNSSRKLLALTTEGVQACEAELWLASMLHVRQDGSSWLEGNVAVQHSQEIMDGIKPYLAERIHIYLQ